jgi:hypothetical protein
MRLVGLFLFSSALSLFAGVPTDVLLQVLEKVKKGASDIEKLESLGISPFCGPNQKELIQKRWRNLAGWAEMEEATFTAGSEKIEGDFAAVVIAANGKSGPDYLRILGFGLRKKNGEWKIAPNEGSFANAGIGFEETQREQAREMERWLSKERFFQEEKFYRLALQELKKSLLVIVDAKVLKKAKAEEALEHFLAAVRAKKEKELLIWQGALEREADDEIDWERVTEAAEVGLKGKDRMRVWNLLTDPGVLQVKIESDLDPDESSILMGFITSKGNNMRRGTANEVIRFNLVNNGSGWRVKMPAFFAYANENQSIHYSAKQDEANWRDRQHSSELVSLFEKQFTARRGKTPEDLMGLLAKDFGKDDYREYARLLRRKEKAGEDAEEDAQRGGDPDALYVEAAKWWSDAKKAGGTAKLQVVKHEVKGDLALGIFRSARETSWEPDFLFLWMMKTKDGWSFLPNSRGVPPKKTDDIKALEDYFKKEEKILKEDAEKNLLTGISIYVPEKSAPSKGIARKTALAWRKSLLSEDVMSLVGESGSIKIPGSPKKLLRDLTQSMKGARAGVVEDRLIDSKSEGAFHGVSMMVDAGRGLEMNCPLMVVAETEKGPRVLLDVELWLPTNRGKEFQNNDTFERLDKELGEEELASLKALFEWHKEVTRPVWDAWDAERNAKD